jgi:hypothetical protein
MKERPKRGSGALVIEGPSIAGGSVRSANFPDAAGVIGGRFKMSSLGAARNPNFAGKEGTIVGNSRLNCSIRVLFDGRKTPISLHRDYIEANPFAKE